LQGEQGFSVKSSEGQASHYFSLPFLDVSGSIQIKDEHFSVSGEAWLDREWSSQPLSADQQGWDWFSLHLDQGDKLMLFRLRHKHSDNYFSGTYIYADGTSESLQPDQIRMQPLRQHTVANRKLPVEWQLTVEDFGISLRTQALNPNAWMATGIAYWEGPIHFTGSHSGKGYLEMTGY
jgi:predicted secreted hydrolase